MSRLTLLLVDEQRPPLSVSRHWGDLYATNGGVFSFLAVQVRRSEDEHRNWMKRGEIVS